MRIILNILILLQWLFDVIDRSMFNKQVVSLLRNIRSVRYQQPSPPPRQTSVGNKWGFRKLFGIESKPQKMIYAADVSHSKNKEL